MLAPYSLPVDLPPLLSRTLARLKQDGTSGQQSSKGPTRVCLRILEAGEN